MIKNLLIILLLVESFNCFSQQSTNFSSVIGFTDNGDCTYTSNSSGWNNNMLTSENFVASNTDGSISYTVSNTSDKLAFGLSEANSSIKVKDITYRMLIGKKLSVWENKKMKGNYGNLSIGDVLTISRINDQILFLKNGNVILSLTTDPSLTLYTKISSQTSNLTLSCDDFPGDYYEYMESSFVISLSNCLSDSLGSINFSIINGVAPYTYLWSSGETSKDLLNKEIGQYIVTVNDAIGFQLVDTIDILTCIEWENIQEGIVCDEEFIKPDAWLKLFGGNTNEYPGEIISTSDGGYIMSVSVADGSNLPNHNGGSDAWIVKLDEGGEIEWSNMLGGTSNENLSHLAEDGSGNFLCAGGSFSSDGDVPSNQGDMDFWIVKLDVLGNIIWSKTYGGSARDRAFDINVTADGGYVVGGESWSNDGDISGGSSFNDYWQIKLDVNGNLVWETSVGGTSFESSTSVIELSNGQFFITGLTFSRNGDFAGITPKGGGDLGAVKLDSNGTLIWVNLYGGTGQEGLESMAIEESDGIIIGSRTTSSNGDVPNNNGSNDYWLFKIDFSGSIIWSKTYGGSGNDPFMDVKKTIDGGYLLTGWTFSSDGDVHNNHGGSDIWTIKVDSVGDTLWTQTYGGPDNDEGTSVVQGAHGEYLVLGVFQQASSDGTIDDQACLKKILDLSCNEWDLTAIVEPDDQMKSIAVSQNQLLSNEDGFIQYSINQIGKEELVGLVYYSDDYTSNEVEYGFRISSTSIDIYEKDVLVQQINNYQIGDNLRVAREAGNIVYYYNGNQLRTVPTNPSKIILTKVVLTNAMAISVKANFLYKNFYNSFKYATLQKKLDGSYYKFKNNKIRFRYNEKYRSGNLNYKVYRYPDYVLLSSLNHSIAKRYGDNWITIDLCDFFYSAGLVYILEVSDEKGRKQYLRFTAEKQVNCNPLPGELSQN